jgi:hypothetical protein
LGVAMLLWLLPLEWRFTLLFRFDSNKPQRQGIREASLEKSTHILHLCFSLVHNSQISPLAPRRQACTQLPLHTSMEDIHSSPVRWYGILSVNDAIPKHCARCHIEYTIRSTRNLCSIPHVFKPEPFEEIDSSTGKTIVYFESECCGRDVLAKEVEEPEGSGNVVVRKCEPGLCFVDRHTKSQTDDRNDINNLPCLKRSDGICCREWLRGISGKDDEEVVWSTAYNRKQKPRRKSVAYYLI